MKILHLATMNSNNKGGAFDATYRLHKNMKAAGVDSMIAVLIKTSTDETIIDLAESMTVPDHLRRIRASLCRRISRKRFRPSRYFYAECSEILSARRFTEILPFRPDVIIAHWISNFITARTLHELSRLTGAPVLWYLLDMGPLTGGCHYSFDCSGYAVKCGNCPQLGSGRGELDRSFRQWQARHDAILDMDITPVAASSWLMDRLGKSSIFRGKQGEKILLGLDTNIFSPREQVEARQQLGLPTKRKIIFFGAQNIQEE